MRAQLSCRQRWCRDLWCANLVFLAAMLAAAITVDGNGRLPGLGERVSAVVTSIIIGGGLVVDVAVGVLDRRRWYLALAVGALYAVMLAPVFLG
jgi:hypothetical protein